MPLAGRLIRLATERARFHKGDPVEKGRQEFVVSPFSSAVWALLHLDLMRRRTSTALSPRINPKARPSSK